MNKLKLLAACMYAMISLVSLIMFLLLAYDVVVTVCYVDGNMFCSGWNTIFNIDSGYGHALSMIGFMMISMICSAGAIDICHDLKNDAVHAVSEPGVKNGK